MKTFGRKSKIFECTIRYAKKKPEVIRVHARDENEAMNIIPVFVFGKTGWVDETDVKEVK